MKTYILFILWLALFGAGQLAYGQSKNTFAETRSVDTFSGVFASGSLNVFVYTGKSESVEVEASEGFHAKVVTDVRDGILRVGTNSNIPKGKVVRVNVYAVGLESFSANGAADLTVEDFFSGESMKLKAEGASDIFFKKGLKATTLELFAGGSSDVRLEDVACEEVKVSLVGSSDLILSGKGQHLAINQSGASNSNASKFLVQSCEIALSGSSDARVNAAGWIKGRVSGASDLVYFGQPAITEVSVQGNSSASGRK